MNALVLLFYILCFENYVSPNKVLGDFSDFHFANFLFSICRLMPPI